MSWIVVAGVRNNLVLRLYHIINAITTPIMRPLRRVIPTVGMIDITPMIAIILLVIIRRIIDAALR
jgi:YggT family protein